jgi:hypothetical protein
MWFSSWLGKRQSITLRQRRRASPQTRSSFRPRLEALEDRWLPSQVGLTVTSLADSGAGTLRDAILQADAGKQSDKFTIGFAVTGTIGLQSPLPDLNNSIAIQGPGASSLTVEPAAGYSFASAIITVDELQTASLSGLTIANGNDGGIENDGTLTVANCAVVNDSAAPQFGGLGGGISNFGTLTVSASTLSGNSALAGGGIFNNGTLTVSGSTLSGNSANDGGGIWNEAWLTVSSSTLSGNSASDGGGGIADVGFSMTVSASTIAGNSASFGGGIEHNISDETVTGSTLSGNSAQVSGGAIWSFDGDVTVSGCTISGNSATYGGGISTNNGGVIGGTFVTAVRDSVLTGNSATDGGAIYNANGLNTSLDVRGSTLSGNAASDSGGGIYNLGTATVQGSALSGNSAAIDGGGLYNLGAATVQQSTVSGNSAGSAGGGIYNAASGTVTVKDSSVLNNRAPSGADIYNLGVLTLDDSTVGVIGP